MSTVGDFGYPEAARHIIEGMGEARARDLVFLFEQPDAVRAEAFRRFHERGGDERFQNTWANLEADPITRSLLVEHLRLELGEV